MEKMVHAFLTPRRAFIIARPFTLLLAGLALTICTVELPERAAAEEPLAAVDLLRLSIKAMERQDSLLAGYCYTKTVVMEHLDGELSPKKKEERVLEVTSVPHGPDIEVLVAINGEPISEKERKKWEAAQRKSRASGAVQPKLRGEDLITQFDWVFDGSEYVNGRPATVLSFQPKPGAVYEGKDPNTEKFLKRVAGRVWVDDSDRAISRIEFKSVGPIKSLGGLMWTLHSFYVREERTRLPDGVWIDSQGEYLVDATAILVKRIGRRSTTRTHDYRRCAPAAKPG